MKIAILTSGILPVPAVQGGAVENLVDFYLEYNNQYRIHDITIYSIWHPHVKLHPDLQSDANHYIYIKTNSWWAKFKKKLYQKIHGEEYYHYTIEYYLEQSLKHIKKRQYDLIIIENRPGYALKLKHLSNARLVYHLHNDKLNSQTYKAKEIYDAASLIITVSDYIKRCVQTINPQDSKTKTVYNGINLSAFSENVKAERSSVGLQNDDFVLVFSGRINRDKGIMELIEAMRKLNKYPQIKLMVIGSSFFGNTINDDEFTIKLKEKARSLKERIIFTGFIPYSNIPNYLKIADVAVIPSIWDDPFPTTILEAQAIGLPIITTNRGGIPEEVTKENAIIIDTKESFVEELTNTILYLFHHPEKCRQMSSASKKRRKLFGLVNYAKNFFTILDCIG